mgnify:CR=1 FL=1|jgi:hypothetical protein|tara:strand:+ start:1572 stop:1793 length:222 start_codon:yes stop_codon:yes gene_type:complete
MLGFYIIFGVILCLICYAGTEETMRLFAFIDIHIRYSFVKLKLYFLKQKIKRQLSKDLGDYSKLIKEIKDDQR